MLLLAGIAQGAHGQEPYYVCDDDANTVTFYYDNNRLALGGWKIYDDEPSMYQYRYAGTIIFDGSFANYRPTKIKWFSGCNMTTIVGLSNLNTELVSDMHSLFAGCENLTTVDLSSFNTSNVTDMASLFYNCGALQSVNLNGFNTEQVNTMAMMFSGCLALTNLDVSGFNTSNVTDMEDMFGSCSSLTSLDLSNFNTGNVTTMSSMFAGCNNLKTLNISSFNTAKVESMEDMFAACSSLTSLDLSNFDTSNVTSFAWMFRDCESLKSLDLANFNTSKATSFCCMFGSCTSLNTVNLSSFNTSNVTDMSRMFQECKGLTSLDLSNFNTSNVTTMLRMFYNCSSLTSLDLSNFNTSNLIEVSDANSGMFEGCSSLITLNLSNFNTSKVTNMKKLFSGCSSLNTIDLSSFDTSNVTKMDNMFSNCNSLTSIDLSNFNTNSLTDCVFMFGDCSNLETIYVSNLWSSDNLSSNSSFGMFRWCNNLKGGKGTEYDPDHTDGSYAHIDGGSANPGYFTDINATEAIELNPVEEETSVDMPTDNNTTNVVISNVYFNLSGDDGYDETEGCIVINTPTDMTEVDGEPGSETVKENFSGLIFLVNGKGVIGLDCQTLGVNVLNVKVGSQEPTTISKNERATIEIAYDVTEPTYVYVYATSARAGAPLRVSASENCVKLWSLTVKPGATLGISHTTATSPTSEGRYYTLDGRKVVTPTKGVYIYNGKKVILK